MDLGNMKDDDSQQDKNDEIKKSPNKKELENKKKQLTLDLERNLDSSKSRKKQLISNGSGNNLNSFSAILDPNSIWSSQVGKVILESPDMQMFGLHTPDVEKFLSESKLGGSTPTPSLASRTFVHTQQLMKHLGVDHLNLQNNNTNSNDSDDSRPPSNASSNYYQNSDQFNPQEDNSSMISGGNSNCSYITSNNSANNQSFNENADLNPINMSKNQDLSKLDRKRLRNRIAASKCRKRKLERISNLEDRVQKLKNENQLLAQEVIDLREKNKVLKSEVLGHKKNGCNIDISLMQS